MSTSRRRKHRELVAYQQLRTSLRRTFDTLYEKQLGPWKPGPWWPEDSPKYRAE